MDHFETSKLNLESHYKPLLTHRDIRRLGSAFEPNPCAANDAIVAEDIHQDGEELTEEDFQAIERVSRILLTLTSDQARLVNQYGI